MPAKKTIKSSTAKMLNENVKDHKGSGELLNRSVKRKVRADKQDEDPLCKVPFINNELQCVLNTLNSQIGDVLKASESKEVLSRVDALAKDLKDRRGIFENEIKTAFRDFFSQQEKFAEMFAQTEKKIEQICKEMQKDKQKVSEWYTEFLEKIHNDINVHFIDVNKKNKRFLNEIKKNLDKDVEKEMRRILSETAPQK